ncbi:MAG TPA: hypothetical protein PKD85_16350 [Saprospiraceae bacterium]|nr:hypothetical protein [Saprospiraceae bacterium]
MKNLIFTLFICGIFVITSCAKVYYSPESERAISSHKIIAVVNPRVTLPPQKKMTAEEQNALLIAESESFQYQMVSWLLRRKNENKIRVDILDATTTLAKIKNATEDNKSLTTNQLSELLEVDAVLTSNYKLSKPLSTGAAIATTILFGFGNTNQIVVTMELHDRRTNKMIWNFSHTLSGGLFSSSDMLVEEIMRIASKKLPYTKFKK